MEEFHKRSSLQRKKMVNKTLQNKNIKYISLSLRMLLSPNFYVFDKILFKFNFHLYIKLQLKKKIHFLL